MVLGFNVISKVTSASADMKRTRESTPSERVKVEEARQGDNITGCRSQPEIPTYNHKLTAAISHICREYCSRICCTLLHAGPRR
jgi:hypothetical protein